PSLAPGMVLLADSVLLPEGKRLATDARWRSELDRALAPRFSMQRGDLLSSAEILETPRQKVRAALVSGAVAVALESGGVARAANEAGVPFIALKVVIDGLADRLPANAEQWID